MQMATEKTGLLSRLQVHEFDGLRLAYFNDRDIGIAEIINTVDGKSDKEPRPSVGEDFFYAIINRKKFINKCLTGTI